MPDRTVPEAVSAVSAGRPGRRAVLTAGLLAGLAPLLSGAAPAGPARVAAAPPVGPNRLPVRPPTAAWVRHGRTARAAGVEREVAGASSVRILWGARTDARVVALTWDDGPSPEYTGAVLDALAAADARATFFVVGERVRRFPDLVRRQAAEGHEIGNHTDGHDDLARLTEEAARVTLERAGDAVAAAVGERPAVLRPPYGHLSGAALAAAGALDLDVALWTHALDEVGLSPEDNVVAVLDGLRPGGVVLAHDHGDARRAVGLAALPGVLAGLRDAGYATVTVSELLAIEARAEVTTA